MKLRKVRMGGINEVGCLVVDDNGVPIDWSKMTKAALIPIGINCVLEMGQQLDSSLQNWTHVRVSSVVRHHLDV